MGELERPPLGGISVEMACMGCISMTFKKLVHKHIKTRCKNHFRLALRFASRYSGIVISDEHRSIRKTAVGAAVFAFWGVLKAGLLLLFSERDV